MAEEADTNTTSVGATTEMRPKKKRAVETNRDLAQGQIVIVTARWILVLAALILTLWNPPEIGTMRIQILFIIMLAFANFYLHAEIMRQQPTVQAVAYLASAGDLFVITLIIIAQGGLESGAYAFYFPAILAFAVAFPTAVTFFLTIGTVFVYFMIALVNLVTEATLAETLDLQVVVARLVMFAAVAYCGNLYRRIEHTRRREAVEAHEQLMEKVLESGAPA
jgi:hypothetical protein